MANAATLPITYKCHSIYQWVVRTVVDGVLGSGKKARRSLTILSAHHPDALVIDQAAVGTYSRSNPLPTYTGIMDDVRKAFGHSQQC